MQNFPPLLYFTFNRTDCQPLYLMTTLYRHVRQNPALYIHGLLLMLQYSRRTSLVLLVVEPIFLTLMFSNSNKGILLFYT